MPCFQYQNPFCSHTSLVPLPNLNTFPLFVLIYSSAWYSSILILRHGLLLLPISQRRVYSEFTSHNLTHAAEPSVTWTVSKTISWSRCSQPWIKMVTSTLVLPVTQSLRSHQLQTVSSHLRDQNNLYSNLPDSVNCRSCKLFNVKHGTVWHCLLFTVNTRHSPCHLAPLIR